ncbi:DUF427 domain-containing protein [Ornithinimicrobium tianjinense]|uniref:DUF427 domain-containing protein n=1 Tax=Ornithinimicrobium tianjinense TaxID=1195761 RepID=A0A917BGI9_9MICO|nr:DUF427 domain-containing protein [Ornithinimicrobium tianjinense]GGF43915.1 hypothetical protein GCM10011366_09600 [Ornithinimicrobium tianjinense]
MVVRLDGTVLADAVRPVALFETHLPTRWCLPREDVRMDLLSDSSTHTVCGYNGEASYTPNRWVTAYPLPSSVIATSTSPLLSTV